MPVQGCSVLVLAVAPTAREVVASTAPLEVHGLHGGSSKLRRLLGAAETWLQVLHLEGTFEGFIII